MIRCALGLVLLNGACLAQTITVTTLEDVVDFAATQQVADLPGPDGRVSMREAVFAVNNTPGPQTIAFAIPTSEWWLVSQYALIKQENGVFFLSDDQTTIDFSSQTDFSGDTNPNGMEVGVYGLEPNAWGVPAIIIDANNCVIRGIGPVLQRGAAVSIWGGTGNRIVGCVTDSVELNPYPGTTSNNVIGGTTPEDANDIIEVRLLCGANDNLVIGNHLQTVGVIGSPYCTEPNKFPLRNRIGGPTPEERNVINGFGRYGEEGFPYGQGVLVDHAQDTLVEGNYIGVTADGMARFSQRGTAGVGVTDSINTTVRGNLISGIYAQGVNHYAGQVFGDAIHVGSINIDTFGVVIENNLIGTDATGEHPILTHGGVLIAPGTARRAIHDVRIGSGDGAGGNVIAYTDRYGVLVSSLTDGIEIAGNDIVDNGQLGIDLLTATGVSGVTLNDPGDADDGANGLQNYPEIVSAQVSGSSVQVEGLLSSRPDRDYRIEVFASAHADPSGFGEGERFLASTLVHTDVTGFAAFTIAATATGIGEGWVATATATDIDLHQTSEFGPASSMDVQAACDADRNGDGILDFFDVQDFLNAFSAGAASVDVNADGVHDFFDLQAYLALFAAGCP